MQINRNEILKVPTLFFVVGIFFYATWGAYDQFFSPFLKITFNNVVKKFVKFCKFFKNLRKKFAILFAKMHERKVAYKAVSYSNFN